MSCSQDLIWQRCIKLDKQLALFSWPMLLKTSSWLGTHKAWSNEPAVHKRSHIIAHICACIYRHADVFGIHYLCVFPLPSQMMRQHSSATGESACTIWGDHQCCLNLTLPWPTHMMRLAWPLWWQGQAWGDLPPTRWDTTSTQKSPPDCVSRCTANKSIGVLQAQSSLWISIEACHCKQGEIAGAVRV